MTRHVRVGAGAGFAGDRIDPAVTLAERGNLDYLVFECLGERTVATGQARRLADPTTGYDPLLAARMAAVLTPTTASGCTVVTNSGAANPLAAAEVVAQVARRTVDRPVRIAAVTGDDVLDAVRRLDPVLWETGRPLSEHDGALVSANAYIGADAVLPALDAGAHVIVTGRLADPSLYLGPLVHEFGWSLDDWHLLGAGTAVGHLLECAGQLTGGYFADPVTKPVAGLANLGFPFAKVAPDGTAVFGKADGTGGELTMRTCAEQLLYEVGRPASYLTPDVTADFTSVSFDDRGPDRVGLRGATGRARPDELKVTVGFRGGWMGEGQMSYAGPRALLRAQLAGDIVRERLDRVHGFDGSGIGVEFIGAGAAFRGVVPPAEAPEVRVRVTASAPDSETAAIVAWEVESLYTNGPAGGGGARGGRTEVLAIRSCSIPRTAVRTEVHTVDVTTEVHA